MFSGAPILQIDLAKIKSNYLALQSKSAAKVAAAVKANCYGLGVEFVAPALEKVGCMDFFVANIKEGLELRKLVKGNIYILNGVFFSNVDSMVSNNLVPVINNQDQLNLWQGAAKHFAKKLPAILHVDTGIHRLGYNFIAALDLINTPEKYSALDIKYVMSHLASASDPTSQDNMDQLEKFNQLKPLANFLQADLSLANSAAIELGDNYHFDLVRPGASLYGIITHPNASKIISNPIKLIAPIIHLQKITKGDKIGYDGYFKATKNMSIATVPIGYADGFKYSGYNSVAFYINNQAAPVVGRISMDLTTIDVTDISEVDIFAGQKVEILNETQTPNILAKKCDTIGYDIITSLANRFDRVYT